MLGYTKYTQRKTVLLDHVFTSPLTRVECSLTAKPVTWNKAGTLQQVDMDLVQIAREFIAWGKSGQQWGTEEPYRLIWTPVQWMPNRAFVRIWEYMGQQPPGTTDLIKSLQTQVTATGSGWTVW